jgi:hypothetical protein
MRLIYKHMPSANKQIHLRGITKSAWWLVADCATQEPTDAWFQMARSNNTTACEEEIIGAVRLAPRILRAPRNRVSRGIYGHLHIGKRP